MSIILGIAARYLLPLLLVFGAFLFARGHNAPGGGFTGGLVLSAAFALEALVLGTERARRAVRADPRWLITAGLGLCLVNALAGVAAGLPLLTGMWTGVTLPVVGKLGTPLLFDAGVLVAVLGATLTIVFDLSELR